MYSIPQVKLSYVSDGVGKRPSIRSSKEIETAIRESYAPGEIEYREYFKVVYLNRGNKVIGMQVVSMGGTATTVVDCKIIFTGALLANASGIVLAHNHPSGNTRPSIEDDKITRHIKDGCQTLDIKLMDHIIITEDDYYSYSDEGRL